MAVGYDRQLDRIERFMFAEGRTWVCSQARGDVLEIAVGTGRNLALYPPGIRLTAIDLSPAMLALARERAAAAGLEVDLRLGDAEALAFDDASFDTVVCTLALCTIPRPERAVAEARRVLRPGGRFLVLDHVRSPNPAVRLVQWLLDPILVRFEGDHLLREPIDFVESAGLEVESVDRSRWGIVERLAARKA
jgi:ubiquinone/menaquinone biosynthesis C-methylase UbiE